MSSKKNARTAAKRGEVTGNSWACIEGLGLYTSKAGRGILVIRELHVFSKRDALELARELRTRFVPQLSRKASGKPIDRRVFGEKTAEQIAALATNVTLGPPRAKKRSPR